MSNVRFYRLDELPGFLKTKHQGIFVHVTVGETTHKAGLWFGGVNGWEYLTNDTTPESITNAINALDVSGYAQATIATNTPAGGESNSTLTISGIKEVDGKIVKDDSNKLEVAIDGGYENTNNKIATQSTVKNAIDGLDVNTIQAVTFNTSADNGNTTLTFKGIKEVDGRIAQGDEQTPNTFIVGDAKLKIQIGSDAASDVFSANAQTDSTIKLDGNVFKKDENNVISVITQTAVASDNRLVTEKDIASLGGAMHYKGTVSSLEEFNKKLGDSDAEEAGDVYIATGNFTHKDNVIETGDMIVFNNASEYKVVQSNLTLGTNSAQIAKNDGDLKAGNIVVATNGGIKTSTTITEDTFSGNNNNRDLTYGNGTADGSLYHDVTISDSLTVLGKDLGKTINISSANRSIEIAKKTVNGDDTGVVVDLVWNTSIE